MGKNTILKIFTTILIIISLALTASAQVDNGPTISNIPGQTVACGQSFTNIDLSNYVTDPDNSLAELELTAYDNHLFDVSINNGIATVSHPGISRAESIAFRARDSSGLQQTVRANFVVDCPTNYQTPYPYEPYYPIAPLFPVVPVFFPDHFATHPPETCAISTGHGLVEDYDCDGVPEVVDNCPAIFNPDQADQNYNGIGDACDIVVTSVEVQPAKLSCGRALVASAVIQNNHEVPFGNIKATLSIPNLDVESVNYVQSLTPGSATEVELTSRIPIVAESGDFNIELTLEYNVGLHQEVIHLQDEITVDDSTCNVKSPEDSIVDIREIEDVRTGKETTYAIKIKNTEDRSNSYSFDVVGVDFGSYVLNPSALVIVPAGASETVYLTVTADLDVEEGAKTFVLEVIHKDEIEQVVLVAHILDEEESNERIAQFIITAVVLVAIFLFLVYALMNTDVKKWLDNTKGQKRGSLSEPISLTDVDSLPSPSTKSPIWKTKNKVAKLGLKKERGWLYFVDGQGDVSRSKMTWAR